jgi:hypothetical protein
MAFNARTLAPWDAVSVDFTAVDEYCEWFNEITGDLMDAQTADWIDVWMRTAHQFDVLWLDGDTRPCPPGRAEIQIMRK